MRKATFGGRLNSLPLICLFASGLFAQKIVFVAGPKDHGIVGRHEYEQSLRVLKGCLDQKGFTTELYVGQIPGVDQLAGAAAVVLSSSGDRIPKETHAIFPQDAVTDHKTYDDATTARLRAFDALMKKGTGLVVLHYTTWVDNAAGRNYFNEWAGGYFEEGYSKVVKDPAWHVTPTASKHAILHGIQPWTYEEEFFTKERLSPKAIPLLTGVSSSGVESVLSWAIDRPSGGRGFVFTGTDFHKNMLNEYHRRMLLNGITWAAGSKVPDGGVNCSLSPDAVKPVTP